MGRPRADFIHQGRPRRMAKKQAGEKKRRGRPPSGKKAIDSTGQVTPRFAFTLPVDLKDKLRIVAEKNGRTMSLEIAWAIRQHVAREIGEASAGS